MSFNSSQVLGNADLVSQILFFLSTDENRNLSTVCKLWKTETDKVRKIQYFEQALFSLEKNSIHFLKMVPDQKLQDFCPEYFQAMQKIRKGNDWEQSTVKEVFEAIKKQSEHFIVNANLALRTCILIQADAKLSQDCKDNEVALKVMKHVLGRVFVMFSDDSIKDKLATWNAKVDENRNPYFDLFETIELFPGEIFNITLNDKLQRVISNEKVFCFPFKGKFIEVAINQPTTHLEVKEYNITNKNISIDSVLYQPRLPSYRDLIRYYIPSIHGAAPTQTNGK
jgi:hypothetical protein